MRISEIEISKDKGKHEREVLKNTCCTIAGAAGDVITVMGLF